MVAGQNGKSGVHVLLLVEAENKVDHEHAIILYHKMEDQNVHLMGPAIVRVEIANRMDAQVL